MFPLGDNLSRVLLAMAHEKRGGESEKADHVDAYL